MQAQHIGDSCFHYGHASNDCISSCVATNNCWTTLKYDAMSFFMEFVNMASKTHNMWRYESVVGYMKNDS